MAVRSSALLLRLLLWTLEKPPPSSTVCVIGSSRDPSLTAAVYAMNAKSFNVIFVYPSHEEPPATMDCPVLPWCHLCDFIPQRRVLTISPSLEQPEFPSRPSRIEEGNGVSHVRRTFSNEEKEFFLNILSSLEKDQLRSSEELLIARMDEINQEIRFLKTSSEKFIEKGLMSGDLTTREVSGRKVILPRKMPHYWFVDERERAHVYSDEIWELLKVYLQEPRCRGRIEMTESR